MEWSCRSGSPTSISARSDGVGSGANMLPGTESDEATRAASELRAAIISTSNVEAPSTSFHPTVTSYNVQVSYRGEQWQIGKRYSEFPNSTALISVFGAAELPYAEIAAERCRRCRRPISWLDAYIKPWSNRNCASPGTLSYACRRQRRPRRRSGAPMYRVRRRARRRDARWRAAEVHHRRTPREPVAAAAAGARAPTRATRTSRLTSRALAAAARGRRRASTRARR